MKIYAIYDDELDREGPIGYLQCYDKSNAYIVELCDDLNEWEAPLLFQNLVKKSIYTIPKDISLLWVKERVIPSGRQNIGLILSKAGLKEYNERALLALSKGRCSQDRCYIVEIQENELPDDIVQRKVRNVTECFPSEDGHIICLFCDNMASKVDLLQLKKKYKDIEYLLRNEKLLHSVKVGVGGYSISFNDSIEICKEDLRERKWLLPISANDFYSFVQNNIVNSVQACEALECSRQNLSYLVKTEQLEPVIHGIKENLYTKGSIEMVQWGRG